MDKRDPQKLGAALLRRHKDYMDKAERPRSLSETYDANKGSLDKVEDHDAKHIGPVEKYGRPGDVVMIEEAKAPVFARP